MTHPVAGRSAIITGAGSGIGRAAALRFGAAGAQLLLADWSEESGEQCAAQVRANGGTARFVRADVSSETDVENIVACAIETYGRLDCAFNNAGISGAVAFTADYRLEDWDRVLRVNLSGCFLCMKYEIRAMLASGGGAIVNTASGLGLVAQAGSGPYCAAKAGVLSLTRAAAVEYATRNIRINALMPGLIRTAMLDGASSEVLEMAAARHPIGRLGEPDEIAEAALWLCAGAPAFLTAHSMAVDGGYLAV